MPTRNLTDKLPRQLKLGELRVFVAVMEHGSFRKAAAALHVTQPAVTKAIAGLEDLLGVQLFDRGADGVSPTVHGSSFAPHASAIFGELASAARSLAIVSSGAEGALHVGTIPMPAVPFLPIAIRNLIDAHPKIFVSVIEAREPDLAERLRKREIELAIFRLAMFSPDSDLNVESLFEEKLCVLACRDHPLATRRRVSWTEVLKYPWVMPPAESYFLDHVRRTLNKLGMDLPRHAVESHSIPFQYGLAVHGGMLSFGMRSPFDFSRKHDALIQLPVDLPAVVGTVAAVTLSARVPSPLSNQLVATIRRLVKGS